MTEARTKPQAKTAKDPRKRTKVKAAKSVEGPAESDIQLTPQWQEEYLAGLRLDQARIPPKFEHKSFDTFSIKRTGKTTSKRFAQAKMKGQDYVEAFQSSGPEAKGLLLRGPVGCGKTHVALSILNELIRKGQSGMYFNMPDLLRTIRSTYDPNSVDSESELLDIVNEPDVLIFDDLGSEGQSNWVVEIIYLMVNRRYESTKPLIVTTNLDEKTLEEKLGARTCSRLCEMCTTFEEFPKEDYRRAHMGQ